MRVLAGLLAVLESILTYFSPCLMTQAMLNAVSIRESGVSSPSAYSCAMLSAPYCCMVIPSIHSSGADSP